MLSQVQEDDAMPEEDVEPGKAVERMLKKLGRHWEMGKLKYIYICIM